MGASAEQLLQDLRNKQGAGTAAELLADLRAKDAPTPEPAGIINTLSRNIAQPFNKELLNSVNAPIDLANFILSAFTDKKIPGPADLRASTESLGLTAPEGEEAQGFLPRTAEILGASVLPGGALQTVGRNVIKQGVPVVKQSVLQFLGSQAAKNPRAGLALDVISSLGAGGAGEIASEFTDDPSLVTAAEVGGGFAAPFASLAAPVTNLAKLGSKISSEAIGSFSTPRRVSKKLQSETSDPITAAAKIDVESPISPARQTEEPRLVSLEDETIKQGSAAGSKEATAKSAELSQKAIEDAASIPGDTSLPSEVVSRKAEGLIASVNRRAEEALKSADEAIAKIDPGADPRSISSTERTALVSAEKAARKDERSIWNEINQNAEAFFTKTRKAMDKFLEEGSRFSNSKLIPKSVRKLLADEDPLTLKDIHAVRQEVGEKIAALKAKPGSNNKIRVHKIFLQSLLDDMSEVDAVGVDAARKFSLDLNKKFTRGEVGEILGTSSRQVQVVDDPETLFQLLDKRSASRGIQQFIKASPESEAGINEFVRSRFLLQAVDENGVVNQRAAKREIDSLRNKGVFEELPELENQLQSVVSASNKAQLLKERAGIVSKRGGARLEQGSKKSTASEFLDSPVGEETAKVLTSKTPVQLARKQVFSMGDDQGAKDGLKRSFQESLLKKSRTGPENDAGIKGVSGVAYAKLLRQHGETLKAFGFSEGDIGRMRKSATILRQLQLKPGSKDRVTGIIDDTQSSLLLIPLRVFGAKLGAAAAGGNAGVSLQAAQIGSSRGKALLRFFTLDRAEQAIIDIQTDPELFKAMLLRNNATKAQKESASKLVRAWLLGIGFSDKDTEPSEP